MLFPGVKGFVKHLDGIYKFKCPGDEKDTGDYFYWGGDDGGGDLLFVSRFPVGG